MVNSVILKDGKDIVKHIYLLHLYDLVISFNAWTTTRNEGSSVTIFKTIRLYYH